MADGTNQNPKNVQSSLGRSIRKASASSDLQNVVRASIREQNATEIGFAMKSMQPIASVAASQMLEPPAAIGKALEAVRPLALHNLGLSRIGEAHSSVHSQMLSAIQAMPSFGLDPAFISAIGSLQQAMAASQISVVKTQSLLDQILDQSEVKKSLSVAAQTMEAVKTAHWMGSLARADIQAITSVFGASLSPAIIDMRETIANVMATATTLDQEKLSSAMSASVRVGRAFSATQLKMSALAGFTGTVGIGDALQTEAYRTLFGEWHTNLDLPEKYWRDARVRKRMYRDADVDEGLIAASPGTALEIMIDSGLAAGTTSNGQAVAVLSFGPISMTIRSNGINKDAFTVIDRFERELRKYITDKLETKFGRDWFKVRASNFLAKAKKTREDAGKRDEPHAPLIDFTELGDLSNIIKSNNNWDEVFEKVFKDKQRFDQDLQQLIAIRRPAMHARNVDGIRLVEAICVMQRLFNQMADDGAWKLAVESDV